MFKASKVPVFLALIIGLLFTACSKTKWGTYSGLSLGRALNIGEAGEETITYSSDGKVLSTERKWLKGTQSDTLSGFKAGLDFGAQFLEIGKKAGMNSVAPGAGNLIGQ